MRPCTSAPKSSWDQCYPPLHPQPLPTSPRSPFSTILGMTTMSGPYHHVGAFRCQVHCRLISSAGTARIDSRFSLLHRSRRPLCSRAIVVASFKPAEEEMWRQQSRIKRTVQKARWYLLAQLLSAAGWAKGRAHCGIGASWEGLDAPWQAGHGWSGSAVGGVAVAVAAAVAQ